MNDKLLEYFVKVLNVVSYWLEQELEGERKQREDAVQQWKVLNIDDCYYRRHYELNEFSVDVLAQVFDERDDELQNLTFRHRI